MKTKKMLCAVVMVMMLAIMFTVPAFAAGTGDVAGAIEGTWTDASAQIKTVVNNVVFPVIDLVLAVFFFAKLGMAYFDYRKHGQFEWTAPAILFACLKGGNLLKQKVQFKQQILLAQPKGIQGLKRQKPIPCRPVLFHRKLKGRNQ